MKKAFSFLWGVVFLLSFSCGQSQSGKTDALPIGGGCEGCEALLEFGRRVLSPIDTLPKFSETEPKLKITGIVYQNDGRSPAADVILYVYQTNREGIYETNGDEKGWARRHGIIRGWVKTAEDGRYTFYTFRPASYPDSDEPAHIHLTVKEPGKNPYYLDSFVFEDDPLLTQKERSALENRGGSGIINPHLEQGVKVATRDIILGLSIPNYH
jgi:protocatechuate 3,4-dioxygenase beta subunit